MRMQEIVNSFLTDCELRGLSDKTLETYGYHLKRLLESSPGYPPKLESVQHLLTSIRGKYNADSHYRTFHAFSKYAHKRYKAPDFMSSVVRPRIRREIMPTICNLELNLLATFLENAPLRDKAIICLFVDTAIRSGEASNLKRADVEQYPDRIIIHGKTGYRVAPISETTRELLLCLPVHDDGYVFHGIGRYKNHRLDKTGFYKVVRKYLRLTGYSGKQFGPQILRRSFGRFWLKDGGDMKTLSLILGHKSIKTTDDYYTPLLSEDIVELHHMHSPGRTLKVTK